MLAIKTIQDTIFKIKPEQSSTLGDKDKFSVAANTESEIGWYRDIGTHVLFELKAKAKGRHNWCAFEKHCQIIQDGKVLEDFGPTRNIDLAVPYYSQRDNQREWWRTCFSSTMAMAVQYLKPGTIGGDDHYITLLESYGDTTDPSAHLRLLERLGVNAQFTTEACLEDIDKSIEHGLPCGIGYLHKGYEREPYGGGHWALVKGVTADRRIRLVNDPWGICDKNGDFFNADGHNARYDRDFFNHRWTVANDHDGYLMTFYS